MTTNFPTSIDALVNPTATDSLATVNHADQHANANDAIESLQAKVGVTNSAIPSSLDYRVRNVIASQVAPLKRWHHQFAKVREGAVSGTPYSTDVIWVGDSIGEGYFSGSNATTMVNVFTDNLSKIANSSGRGGRWVPAGGEWKTAPKFSDQDSTLLGTHTITGGAFPSNQVFLNENFATSIFPSTGNATIAGGTAGTASISYTGKTNNAGKTVLTGVTIISYSTSSFADGTAIYFGGDDFIRRGFSLRSRHLLPIAGQNIGDTATLEFTGDNVVVHYRKINDNVGYIGFKLYLKDSSSVYQLIHTSSPINTYTSAGLPYAQDLYAWDAESDYSGTLARGDYKLEVYNYTSTPSGTNYFVSFDGAYICDGNTSQGVKVWNSSLTGASFATFNNTVNPVYNNDWLSALRDGLVNPSLIVIALGTNESANPSSVEASLVAMVNSINAAYAVGFPSQPMPSFAFFVPPADSTTVSSEWDLVRNTFATVASTVGASIWNWAEFTGDVNNETGDPYGWTSDFVHPNAAGHQALGDFATSQALLAIGASTASLGTLTELTVNGDLIVDTNTLKVDSTNNVVCVNGNPIPGFGFTVASTGTSTSSFGGAILMNDNVVSTMLNHRGISSAPIYPAGMAASTSIQYLAGLGTVGAGSTITTVSGFQADTSLSLFGGGGTATNVFAFRGQIGSDTGRYNLFMDGTAPNYLAGRTGVGGIATAMLHVVNTTPADKAFLVKGHATQSGDLLDIQNSGGTSQFKVASTGVVTVTGDLLVDTNTLKVDSTNNAVCINGNPIAGFGFTVASTGTGTAATAGAVLLYPTVTSTMVNYRGVSSTPSYPASMAATTSIQYLASLGTVPASSSIAAVSGFRAEDSLSNPTTGGTAVVTNAYGFQGQIATSGTTRYNLFMNGTAQNYLAGNLGVGVTVPTSKLHVVGSFSRGAPVTKTTNFTLVDTENWIICNGTATITATLPAASTQVGREISLKNIAAFTVVSASSNIVPLAGGAAGTAILPATAGAWATLVSDGTSWVIMQS
jgi:hypothetical protein